MPIYNVTADDSSGIFVYAGDFVDTNKTDGTYVNDFEQTIHLTPQFGGNITIRFNGTAVWLGGNKRDNHGPFSATLDGSSTMGSSFASGDELFQQILFSQTDLENTEHVLIMENLSNNPSAQYLGVDFVTFTTGDGDASTTMQNVTIDDTDSSVHYSDGWTTPVSNASSFYHNDTFHATTTNQASLSFSFSGTGIAVYGGTNTSHGPFSVMLDGSSTFTSSGNASEFRAQRLLYYASNLANTTHNLTLINDNNNLGTALDFDFAVVTQYLAKSHGSSTSPPPPAQTSHSTAHHANIGAIVGGTIGGLIVLLLAILGLVLLRRRQTRKHLQNDTGPTGAAAPVPVPAFRNQSEVAPFLGVAQRSNHDSSTTGSAAEEIPYNSGVRTVFARATGVVPQRKERLPDGSPVSSTAEHPLSGLPVVVPQRKLREQPNSPEATVAYTGSTPQNATSGGHENEGLDESSIQDAGPLNNEERPPPTYGQVFGTTA